MNGYSVFKKAYDMEPSTTDCIRMNIMKQRNPMKKIIFMILLVGSISGQNSILKQFSDAFADIAEKANIFAMDHALDPQETASAFYPKFANEKEEPGKLTDRQKRIEALKKKHPNRKKK